MKVLIVGAGALGSVFGCLLKDKGHEVGLLEPSSRLDDVRALGLRVSGLFGEHECSGFALYASHLDVPAGYYDLVLITVKSFHTQAAAKQIAPRVAENAIIVSLQNGLGNYEAIRDEIGERRVLAGRVIFGARMADRAHAEVTVYAEPVMIGSPVDAVDTARIDEIAHAFSDAGIPTQATAEITKFIWSKMLYNCSLNPLSALLNVPYGRLLESESTQNLMRRMIEEMFAVARAKGIELFWNEPEDYIKLLFGKLVPDTAAHFASMAQDLQAGRRTEIEALNGAIVRLGEEGGVECPVNAALSELVRAAEPLSKFLRRLLSRDFDTMNSAVRSLGILGDPRAVDMLGRLLHHNSPVVRGNATWALGQIDDPTAAEVLISLVVARDVDCFGQASFDLARRRTAEAVAPLIAALGDENPDIAAAAVRALDEMRDPRGSRALIGLLDARRLDLVVRAYPFFIRSGIEGTEDVLIEALNGFGADGMADAFFRSGNAKLEAAGLEFRKSHGSWEVQPGEEKWRPLWGSEPIDEPGAH